MQLLIPLYNQVKNKFNYNVNKFNYFDDELPF